jgi:hypothetical protein
MFFIVPATDYGPARRLLPLEGCFSVFQLSEKRKPRWKDVFHRSSDILVGLKKDVGFSTI